MAAPTADQFLRVEPGRGRVRMGPAEVYALYGPPEHSHGTVHPTHADAEADEHDH